MTAFCGTVIGISSFGALTMRVTPLMVTSEPTQPMTPRYIMCMDAAMSGASASPKVLTRSPFAIMEMLWVRNPYAAMKVLINSMTPITSTTTPERATLSLKFLNMLSIPLLTIR